MQLSSTKKSQNQQDNWFDSKKDNIAYMARAMVSATLPHSKPESDIFQRKNGDYTLTMTAHPLWGLPYGSLARLILVWLTTEAVIKKSPEINLGKSFASFLKKLELRNSGGKRGNTTRVREQLMRLLTCSISCVYHDRKKGICESDQFHISRSFQLWWNPIESNQKEILSNSKIVLSKDFYDELVNSAIPINFDSLKLLRKSSLQIDIYIWLTHKFSSIKKETFILWKNLKDQFGCNYANEDGVFNFRRKFIQALTKILFAYPAANVYPDKRGITLFQSDTHIKKKVNNPVNNVSYPR